MRTSRPRHVVALVAVGSGIFAGCLFNNTLYNAGGLYQEAEDLRLADQDSASSARYREVVAKATKEYEADEDGERQGSTEKVGHGGVPPGSTVDPEIRFKSRCQQLRTR